MSPGHLSARLNKNARLAPLLHHTNTGITRSIPRLSLSSSASSKSSLGRDLSTTPLAVDQWHPWINGNSYVGHIGTLIPPTWICAWMIIESESPLSPFPLPVPRTKLFLLGPPVGASRHAQYSAWLFYVYKHKLNLHSVMSGWTLRQSASVPNIDMRLLDCA